MKNKYDGSNRLRVLAPEDDAATVKLGREWHIPTEAQWQELVEDCIWEKVYDGEKKLIGYDGEKKLIGFKISGKKAPYDKNYIFIPKMNCYHYYYFDRKGFLDSHCGYWTNESPQQTYLANVRYIEGGISIYRAWWTCLYGIRPVFEK